jgi:hypothetical protein
MRLSINDFRVSTSSRLSETARRVIKFDELDVIDSRYRDTSLMAGTAARDRVTGREDVMLGKRNFKNKIITFSVLYLNTYSGGGGNGFSDSSLIATSSGDF